MRLDPTLVRLLLALLVVVPLLTLDLAVLVLYRDVVPGEVFKFDLPVLNATVLFRATVFRL